jgi:hypothetical protein
MVIQDGASGLDEPLKNTDDLWSMVEMVVHGMVNEENKYG